MKSSFPGMDPYLEKHWGDVHQSVITYIRDWLQPRLPSDLRARMQEREYIPNDEENGDLLPAKPLLIHLDIEPVTEGYIEIIDVKSVHRVVTAIELLSLANKRPGNGRRLYLKKRKDQQSAGVNTVEIDLLRSGRRVLMVGTEQIPPSDRTTYQVCVWRESRPNLVEVYRVPLRERLPVISIPLRPADPDVPLDLQPILEQCYRNGGYDDIDYTAEPDPSLPIADATWADALLREHARR
jgi:hypothetical protein